MKNPKGPTAEKRWGLAALFSGPDNHLSKTERLAPAFFLMPAVLIVLAFSVFPLLVSLYIALTRFRFVKGGIELKFVGFLNFKKLLFGSERSHLLGRLTEITPVGWVVIAIVAGVFVWYLVRFARSELFSPMGFFWRAVMTVGMVATTMLVVSTLFPGGLPGTMVVTLIYVIMGVSVQYFAGMGLALLCSQHLPGRRFFRVVFFLPMMITPVGIAYTFRMMTDTHIGPFQPVWEALGLSGFSWVNHPWGARGAILIGDTWQWIPFMFIVLLAALESMPQDPFEAAMVDGANKWQIFREITWPSLAPVSATLILIRMIESFKIIDMPNVLTNGGPGTASESLTLHSFIDWRTLNLGGSAAVAYILLFVVSFFCLSFAGVMRDRVARVT